MQRVRKREDDGEWIQEEAKVALEKLWVEPDYVKKRDKAMMNRASETGGCTNTGGSIPHSEHKKRLNDYNKLKEACSSQASTSGESPLEPQDDDSIFMEVTKWVNKKGRVYGLGSKA
ncbi:uncharacterized protein LOC119996202 [Tripterygium wilfordii]|uniref:uncharacterized protein LOC119996202 n=1 Tax=Tripterygium wilfordii TaxID=458696 RepID=UPI0018F8163D|nr:uncharacterized protein LOC119996202 [Tripterygium wilfordii]